jgi:hypothetical protein
MARVAVRNLDTATPTGPDRLDYFRGVSDPIHLALHDLAAARTLTFAGEPAARLAYVWSGAVVAGDRDLPAGSVVIAERLAQVTLIGRDSRSRVLVFGAAACDPQAGEGGKIHMLPADRAPRIEGLGASGVGGTLFADGSCPTCGVWLHENRFPPGLPAPADPQAGVHSHEESEIIFITAGRMRLGNRQVGPGTAIAIEAGTLYSFLPGAEGLTFVNFRAGRPGLIHFADGRTADEVAVWSRTDRPLEYLTPA